MSEFKRETRYLVLKHRDLYALTAEQRRMLDEIIVTVRGGRRGRGADEDMKCVVVESDWPMYEHTWELVEAHVALSQPDGVRHLDMGDWLK